VIDWIDAAHRSLVAHVIEEQSRERPMRRIDPVNHGYDGTPARSLSDKSSF